MKLSERLQFGPYQTPKFKIGDRVMCERRGPVQITGLTDGRIPWPTGKPPEAQRQRTIVLYGALVDAVRNESSAAICYWFGVSDTTVTMWRKTLDISRKTPGSSALWSRSAKGVAGKKARAEGRKVTSSEASTEAARLRYLADPNPFGGEEGRRKNSDARRGKNYRTAESFESGTETRWRNGGRNGRGYLWSKEEDELLLTMTPAEVANRLGRSLGSVYKRRQSLGLITPRKQK